jgi:hypothetical protein
MTYQPIETIDPPYEGYYESRTRGRWRSHGQEDRTTVSHRCCVTGVCSNGFLRIKVLRPLHTEAAAYRHQTKYVSPEAVERKIFMKEPRGDLKGEGFEDAVPSLWD